MITVIIPTYNVEKIIERCLVSIKNQTYPEIEILVIDDSSTDNTEKIVRKYANYRKYICPKEEALKKKGLPFTRKDKRTAQRNYGAKLAKGTYLLFIDSDMELPRDLIKECMDKIGNNDAILIDDEGISTTFWSKCHDFEKDLHKGDEEVTSPRFIKKSVFLSFNGLDENLTFNEDIDLHQRMRKNNCKIIHTNTRIKHYESDSLKKIIQTYYKYGKTANKYFKKNPKHSIKLYILYHPMLYIKHIDLVLKNPIYGFGSILRKIIEYSASFAGVIKGGHKNY